jgi:hypothetical protein
MSRQNPALYAVMAPGRAPNFKARLLGDRLLDEPYRCRILYPQENEHDRAEAMTLTGLAGVEMIPVAGVRNHNLIPYLVSKDRLNAELVWLLDGR